MRRVRQIAQLIGTSRQPKPHVLMSKRAIIPSIFKKSFDPRLGERTSENDVMTACKMMESTLSMVQELPLDAPVTVSLTHRELYSFVSYMAILDTEYRLLRKKAQALVDNAQKKGEICVDTFTKEG